MTAGPVGSPDRQIGLMRPIRYVPLALVVVATFVAGVIGSAMSAGGSTSTLDGMPTPPAPARTLEIIEGEGEPTINKTCRAPIDAPPVEPWAAENAAASDAVWQANAESLGQAYVEGDDGFVFWGDVQNNNFSQAVGRRTLSPEELQTWVTSLRSVHEALVADGIEFYIVPSPAKWDVYPELLPEWARLIDGSGPLEQLLTAAPDLPIVDLRADLRQAATDHPVYSSVNSHWSDYGAWVGWSTILRCLAATNGSYTQIAAPEIDGVGIIEGGNEFAPWGFAAAAPDWSVPLPSAALSPVRLSVDGNREVTRGDEQRVGLEEMPSTTINDTAFDQRSVLFLRDSMGTSLSPWLQQSFERVRQIRHGFDLGDPALIPNIPLTAAEQGVDIVILQFAQRHLNAPPALLGN